MEEYEQLMKNVMQYGAVGLSLGMAQETGIVRVLCQADTALTSAQVAEQAGLKERYVRELLGALVCGKLVQLSPGTGGRDGQEARYWVPEDQRKPLDKTAKSSLYLSTTARQFAAVRDVFQLDGPSCIRFNSGVFEFTDYLGPFWVDRLLELMFKPPGLRQKLESGADVAEVGSGKGWLMLRLAAMFPKSRFTITDVVQSPLDGAKAEAEAKGLTNVTFQIVDACDPPFDWNERFDWILTLMTIHDVPHPQKAMNGVAKALRAGGIFSMKETFVSNYLAENATSSDRALVYTLSTFNCIPESYQQADSEALGACWGEDTARRIIHAAGLKLLDVTKMEKDGFVAVFNCQKTQ